MSGATGSKKKRGILSLSRLVRDVLPDVSPTPPVVDDDPTDRVPVLNLEGMTNQDPELVLRSSTPAMEPAGPGEEDSVHRLAESTGVPVASLSQDNRQAAARQLEAELHRRLSRWIRLEEELRHQKAETDRLVSALDVSRVTVMTLETTVQRLSSEGEDARKQIEALQAQIAAERQAASSASTNNAALERESHDLRASLEEHASRLAQDGNRLAKATAELESYKDALVGLQATLKEQQAGTEKHDREKAALAAAVADLEAALTTSRAQQRDDNEERDELRAKVKQAEAAIASKQSAANAELTRLQGVYQAAVKKSDQLTAEVSRWEVAASRAEEAGHGLSALVARLERSLDERQGKVSELEIQLADRVANLNVAAGDIKALQASEAQLRLQIEENETELDRRLGQVDALEQLGGSLTMERDQQRATIGALNDEIRRQKKLLDVLGSGMPNMADIAATVTSLDAWVSTQSEENAAESGGDASACRIIEELHGSQATKHLLDKDIFTIGRSADSDLRVGGPYTSRHHARILNQASNAVIEDLGSSNGIVVNHEQVARCVLSDGDIVEIGGTRFRFVDHVVNHERTLHG